MSAQIRRNEDGALEEIVGEGHFHLEQLGDGAWWMRLRTEDGDIDCVLYARRATIHANCQDFRKATYK